MNNLIENFETLLKKKSTEIGLRIYKKDKIPDYKLTDKPSDVIKSVASQLKAIQASENPKFNKLVTKELKMVNKSNLLSVSKLPVFGEASKQHTNRFATQYVSDTQLINVIEDVELVDNQIGMTEEFETSFRHRSNDNYMNEKKTAQNDDEMPVNVTKPEIKTVNFSDNVIIDGRISTLEDVVFQNTIKSNNEAIQNDIQNNDNLRSTELCVNNCTEPDVITEQIPSPVFDHKILIHKPKSPSPLVFNLDVFEKFENLASSIIGNCAIEKVRHVINSQIIGKELHVQMDAEIELNKLPIPTSNTKLNSIDKIKTIPVGNDHLELENSDSVCDSAKNYMKNTELENDISSITVQLNPNEDPGKTNCQNEGHFIQDEILFSSDEEDAYVNRAYQDIPFTCALETSFYEQSAVLDKTNYVGFQTASNRSIQVSTESLVKAKSILSDVATENLSLMDMVKLCDFNKISDTTDTKTNPEFNENSHSEDKNLNTQNIYNTALKPNHNLNSLNTTITNEIKMSLLHSEKDHVSVTLEKECNFHCTTKEINPNDVTNIHDDLIIQEFENIEMSLEENHEHGRDKDILEFKTASNKTIKISDSAIAKSKNVFQDRDLSCETYDKGLDSRLSDTGFPFLNQANLNPPAIDYNAGFKTASNKQIKISENALHKTKNIFQDIDSKSTEEYKCTINHRQNQAVGCKVNNVKTSTFNDYDSASIKNDVFVGFKTANNKAIKISDAFLTKVNTIFKDIDSPNFNYPIKTVCGSKKEKCPELNTSVAKISERSLKKYEIESDFIHMESEKLSTKSNIVPDNQVKEDKIISDVPMFQGFKTANNKKLQISEQALLKTKNIFKDINLNEDFDKEFEKKYKCKEPPGKPPSESTSLRGSSQKVLGTVINIINTKCNIASGFQTASNKPVSISKEALAKTKKIFHDIDEGGTFENNNVMIHTSSNNIPKSNTDNDNETELAKDILIEFQNICNKSMSIPKQALTMFSHQPEKKTELPKAENKFKKIDNSLTVYKTISKAIETSENSSMGFQTASNKNVAISEEALAKSKKLFHEFHTAFLEQTKENKSYADLTETENILKQTDKLCFSGFQTARKSKVDVSEEALIKSRKIFQDIDYETRINSYKVKVSKESDENTFKVFQTANNKNVNVSDKALAKTKNKFHDMDYYNTLIFNKEAELTGLDFKTANNQNTTVSKKASKETKKIFSDFERDKLEPNNIKYCNKKLIVPPNDNLESIIDTQVLNNFEESLHTEDFHIKTPLKSKRSGSPILSCPRAKKRKKFEIPYSQKAPKKDIQITSLKSESIVVFDANYKKNKVFTLKDFQKLAKVGNIRDPDLENLDIHNILDFQFTSKRNDLCDGTMTLKQITKLFIDSVNNKLVPSGWVENHLKLILWKLISYEIKFGKLGIVCTVNNILNQLKYRYDRELYNAERPALRKIFEKDDVSTKTIVLCVVEIYADGIKVSSVTNPTSNIELLLTDGWYCIMATIDKMVSKLVYDGKIVVGTKIVTSGAELVNCEHGVSPWENTSAIRLKLSGNSTRRARWDARLGYHGNVAILSQLSNVKMDGGRVSKLRIFITRVYPALYVEKFDDGSTVTRSERLEHLHQMKYETERQILLERLYDDVEKEFNDQDSQDSEGYSDSGSKRSCLDSGTQIAKVMKKSNDPAEFRAQLTYSQTKLLEDHTTKRREKLLEDIQIKLQEKIKKNGLTTNRNVVPVLKLRVAGFEEKNRNIEVTKGMLSIWKPNDAILEIIREGSWIDVMNVVPTGIRYSEIQISAGRQSIFSRASYKESDKMTAYTKLLKRQCFNIKDLAQNPTMATDYNEIDTVGLVFLIDPSIQDFDATKQLFQNVYLADADKNMVCVNFWGGLKKFGFDNVLDTGQVISCANLQKRAGNTRKSIPQYRVTEFSCFTKTPKNEIVRNTLDELNKIFQSLDRRKFCEACIVLKNNYAVFKYQNSEISPYRPNHSEYNLSKNKLFIDSPATRQNRDFNLTGLDFESSFKQTDTQNLPVDVLLRKKQVNEKINKLKRYGEPPPLCPIHIINKSKTALSNFKSPLISKDNNSNAANALHTCDTAVNLNTKSESTISAANLKNTPQKNVIINISDNRSSPVLMNRTYVKSVNPVKLNFDVKKSHTSGDVDHFAEDFDGSPPLSLD